ncbi:MAG: hypothetical protein AAGA56_18765 [Myxococcota bacterium]
MTERRVPVRDLVTAAAVTGMGALSVTVGFGMSPEPWAMSAAVEGAMVAGVLGFGLALVHGFSYRATLSLLGPILFLQGFTCWMHKANLFALLGVEIALAGLCGLVLCGLAART